MSGMQVPIEVYDLLERRLGRDDAMAVAKSIEEALSHIEQRSHEISLQRKLEAKQEIKRELREELATKEDLAKTEIALRQDLAKTEIALRQDLAKMEIALRQDLAKMEIALRQDMAKMDKKFTVYFLVTIFVILFTNQSALEFLARLLGLIK